MINLRKKPNPPLMTKVKISAVICTYNRAELLDKCIKSLTEQSLDKSKYEIIIVNNNSTDNTQEVINKWAVSNKQIVTVLEKQQGKSFALNAGIKKANGKYVAFTDDDIYVEPDWLERLLYAFTHIKPEPVSVGGKIIPYFDSTPPQWFIDGGYEFREKGDVGKFLELPQARNGFSGGNVAYAKWALIKINGYSTSFGPKENKFIMGEDTEISNRIHQQNPNFWYDPDIVVNHFTPDSHFRYSFWIKRSYLTGIANAKLKPVNFLSKQYVRRVIYLLSALLDVFVATFSWKKEWKLKVVNRLRILALSLGKLTLFK